MPLDLGDLGGELRPVTALRILASVASPANANEPGEWVLAQLADILDEARQDPRDLEATIELRLRRRHADLCDRLTPIEREKAAAMMRLADGMIPLLAGDLSRRVLDGLYRRQIAGIERAGTLARAPASHEALDRMATGLGKAITAGRILRLRVAAERHHRATGMKASMNRLLAVVCRLPRPGGPRHKADANGFWTRWRRVSHYAAALMDIAAELGFEPTIPCRGDLAETVHAVASDPLRLLQKAVGYERHLETARIGLAGAFMVPHGEIVRVPPFPDRRDDVEADPGAMREDELEAYLGYRVHPLAA